LWRINFSDLLWEHYDVIRYSIKGVAILEDSLGTTQEKVKWSHTDITKASEPERIKLYIPIVSVIGGLILLILIIVILIRRGFFRRTKKEEMDALKHDYVSSALIFPL